MRPACIPASVIKLFVMEAVYAGAAEKKISLSSYVNTLLDSMITISDNESYNEFGSDCRTGQFRVEVFEPDAKSSAGAGKAV